MEIALRRWWTNKYRLPITSDAWRNADYDDLLVEFFEDQILEDDDLAKELRLKYLGYEMAKTGDPLIDMWEKQIAQGQVPDLDIGEAENARARDEKIRKKAREHYRNYGRESLYKAPEPEDQIEKFYAQQNGRFNAIAIDPEIAREIEEMAQSGKRFESISFGEDGVPLGDFGERAAVSPSDFDRWVNSGDSEEEFTEFDKKNLFSSFGEKVKK